MSQSPTRSTYCRPMSDASPSASHQARSRRLITVNHFTSAEGRGSQDQQRPARTAYGQAALGPGSQQYRDAPTGAARRWLRSDRSWIVQVLKARRRREHAGEGVAGRAAARGPRLQASSSRLLGLFARPENTVATRDNEQALMLGRFLDNPELVSAGVSLATTIPGDRQGQRRRSA